MPRFSRTFDTGFRSLRLGAAVRHFGPQVKYVGKSYPLPQTFTLGVSADLLGPDRPLVLASRLHRLLVEYDMSHPRDYNQQHHLGMEYVFADCVCLRAGYKLNYDEEGPTWGLGLSKRGLRIDYSYAAFGPHFDAVQRFTLGISLN